MIKNDYFNGSISENYNIDIKELAIKVSHLREFEAYTIIYFIKYN